MPVWAWTLSVNLSSQESTNDRQVVPHMLGAVEEHWLLRVLG